MLVGAVFDRSKLLGEIVNVYVYNAKLDMLRFHKP